MRLFISPLAALGVLLAAPTGLVISTGSVLAQTQPAPAAQGTQQIPLTAAQVEGFIAVQKPLQAIMSKLPPAEADNPTPATIAKLDALAKANKFKDFGEYQTVADNVNLVFAGIDPQTKKYVGAEAVIKAQIAQIQADKTISAADKKEQLDQLNEALKSVEPVKIQANIPLVVKYYDQIVATMPQDQ